MTGPAPSAPVPVLPQPGPRHPAETTEAGPGAPDSGRGKAEPGGATPDQERGAPESAAAALQPAPNPAPADGTDDDGRARGDPVDEGTGRDPFDDGAQPDPFAEATPERPVSASDGASGAGRPAGSRTSAEALAEAAAGDRLELLRSVFPGQVLRLVPHASTGPPPGPVPSLEDASPLPLDTPADADGVEPDPNEPGGSA